MNIVDGLARYKARKRYGNNDIAALLDCSPSVVSLYLSGKSGLSLEKLAVLLKDGMTLEEAFGDDVASAIRSNIAVNSNTTDNSLDIVVDGLKKIIAAIGK